MNSSFGLGGRGLIIVLLATFSLGGQASESFDHGLWDQLLTQNLVVVREGQATQVDYGALLQQRQQLQTYLSQLEGVSQSRFNGWSRDNQLAFLINSYNAWTVELIVRHYPDLVSIRDLGSWFQSPWKKEFIPLLGTLRSLDDIEHNLIRGSGLYNEPRIHFAVNCASVGCPALRAQAYTGAQLETQLEAATRSFLADRSRNRMLNGELQVSKIFKWYREDFASGWRGSESLAQFLTKYGDALALSEQAVLDLKSGELDIVFLDYDWALNRTF